MLDNIPDTLTLAELQSVLQIGKNTALRLVHNDIINQIVEIGQWLGFDCGKVVVLEGGRCGIYKE